MRLDANEPVIIEPARCNRCLKCIPACPFQAIRDGTRINADGR
jgi:Fe-S-cluster-containing hydrogenase component 2